MKIFLSMPEGHVTDTFFTERTWAMVREFGEITQNPYGRYMTIDELTELAKDCEILITGWGTPCIDKAAAEKMPNLKLIAHTAGSVAALVTPEIYDMGIQVIGGNDVFAKSVAEGALCYTLCALRRIEHYVNVVRTGGWRDAEFQNRGLFGKKVGIVGFGTISKHFLNLIRWYGNEVLIYSSHLSDEEAAVYGGRTAGLEEIFSTCDVISIHSSMTPKTKGLVTRELLASMKKDALLVNTARGPVIDEVALFQFLHEGRFFAALDVYEEEPLLPDNPIRQCENAFLMPHMGGPTIDMREVVVMELCKDFARYQKGEPMLNVIDCAAAKRMTR